jgi:hypothetical protein
MLETDLIRLYPRLYHMAAYGSWDSIKTNGLLSTSRLLQLWEVAPESVRRSIETQRRSDSVSLSHPELGEATIRDQKPIDLTSLELALRDMSLEEWFETLNSRVFFFLQRERLRSLVNARSYRDHEQLVLTFDTAEVVQRYGSVIELCRMNSGFAQPHNHVARGSDTFKPIDEFEHRTRLEPRLTAPWDVHELTIPGGVTGVQDLVIRVERVKGNSVLEVLFDKS